MERITTNQCRFDHVVRTHRLVHRPLCGDTKGFEASTAVGIGRHPVYTRDSMWYAFSDLFARLIGQKARFLLCSRPTTTKTADWQSDLQQDFYVYHIQRKFRQRDLGSCIRKHPNDAVVCCLIFSRLVDIRPRMRRDKEPIDANFDSQTRTRTHSNKDNNNNKDNINNNDNNDNNDNNKERLLSPFGYATTCNSLIYLYRGAPTGFGAPWRLSNGNNGIRSTKFLAPLFTGCALSILLPWE